MKLEEFQQLGKNIKFIVMKFKENPGKFANLALQMYRDIEKERDSYKQQRDELIKDVKNLRAERDSYKAKAKAFDEIDNLIVNNALNNKSVETTMCNISHVIIDLKECGNNED